MTRYSIPIPIKATRLEQALNRLRYMHPRASITVHPSQCGRRLIIEVTP
jgi:hypothetical protein